MIGREQRLAASQSRKRWIAFFNKAQGSLIVDDGARRAICEKGTSLLPAGIRQVEGTFSIGALVNVRDAAGVIIARGLTEYASDDIRVIMGHKTQEIAALLGAKDYDEVIHRDHMLVMRPTHETRTPV